jgi:hypothetical protein
MARSRNHCCHVNAVLLSIFVVVIYICICAAVNNVVNIEGITTHCYQHFGTSVYLCINCLIFLSDLKQIWIFCIDFKRIPRYKISPKSVHWDPSGFMRTDGQTLRKLTGAFCVYVRTELIAT